MVIHLIAGGKYENKEDWPQKWIECFNSLAKTKNDICIWNDEGIEKLLKEDNNEFYDEYLSKLDPIYRWDYVRYIILEKYGGAYFDMDIEIIDDSFIDKLHPEKIYLMEGTGGIYVENSIMISPLTRVNKQIWQRVKWFAKNKIITNFEKCNDPYNVLWIVGPQLISNFFVKHLPQNDHRGYYDILAWEHFANLRGTINYTKHHQTHAWRG